MPKKKGEIMNLEERRAYLDTHGVWKTAFMLAMERAGEIEARHDDNVVDSVEIQRGDQVTGIYLRFSDYSEVSGDITECAMHFWLNHYYPDDRGKVTEPIEDDEENVPRFPEAVGSWLST